MNAAKDDDQSELLKQILLDMAAERSMSALLSLLVERLRGLEGVALARIWLIKPGDICATCPARAECPDQTACLHLAASAASPASELSGTDWFRIDGSYRRFPLRIRHIGTVGTSGESMLLHDTAADSDWFARGNWLHAEGIKSFAGHPLMFRGEILGVLGVFQRTRISEPEFSWLRAFADHAAAAIANARAFEEIERLKQQVELENEYLQEEVRNAHDFREIVGGSLALGRVLRQIELVAPTDSSVLILGESGTGKELIARAIHERSQRRARTMVKVNCGAIPSELFESEFFGHVKGAFTGAVKDRVGRFQLADRGTLFLDEVAEIPLELQSKLLRVLQEGTFERIGDETTRTVDVRIIAATNRSLEERVEAGELREDLFYRLNVFPIAMAPLRDRREDIPALVADCLTNICKRMGVREPALKKSEIQKLQSYDWPGNVRELQNVIERAVITARTRELRFDLPKSRATAPALIQVSVSSNRPSEVLKDEDLKLKERDNLLLALERTNGRVSGPEGAAALVGVPDSTFRSRLKALGIRLGRLPLVGAEASDD